MAAVEKKRDKDYGAAQKKLSIYLSGMLICSLLTILAFWVVMRHDLPNNIIFGIIYAAAVVQLFAQLICFIRLNVKTPQSQLNVLSFIFAIIILITIVIGSIWIMDNLNYNMIH